MHKENVGIFNRRFGEKKQERREGEKEGRQKGRWRAGANAQERFGRPSKTFIIFDVNYQTP